MKFVFDLDGTICFKGKPVSKKIVECLLEVASSGHEVIFASARPIRDMLPVLDSRLHGFTLIGGNGSLVYENRDLNDCTAFSAREIEGVISLMEEYEATYLVDSDWDYAYTGPTDHPIIQNLDPEGLAKNVPLEELSLIVKMLILTSSDYVELSRKLSELDMEVHEHGNERVLDISPPNINKWMALSKLGVREQDYIAFGNDANDISMFENAKVAVMIGEHGELSDVADEKIDLTGDVEDVIVGRIEELARKYREVVQ
ncbi:Cof-type HAD-IIB family hydrolase [Rossellomorea aquimaris]|uniref:HAD-IIB family hydrolase n=1 Tax=Rossellomorea aquimaris TaxID=189382 RepID=UPI001CD22DD5|nr:HAD family hydrolase [Rossellomorea aquimaris]MCA1054356.1 Cof-type HAD-IIB family hydrolase [Rossellomorea aquimaris]